VTFNVIHRLQVFVNAIFRAVMQWVTRFQLTWSVAL